MTKVLLLVALLSLDPRYVPPEFDSFDDCIAAARRVPGSTTCVDADAYYRAHPERRR